MPYRVYKQVGETPLEAIERFRAELVDAGKVAFEGVPITYAGRLDPMACGELIMLVGDECRKKDEYLGLDKEYEVDILCGVSTDTGDVLGFVESVAEKEVQLPESYSKYVGKIVQKYPMYSSKTVKGKQLHQYAREGVILNQDEIPQKEVEIYSIKHIKNQKILGRDIVSRIVSDIEKVSGNFRQEEIKEKWLAFRATYGDIPFTLITVLVACSSGTYMRLLAERIGEGCQLPALAYRIKRTKIMW